MARDRLQNLRDHDRAVGLLVDPVQQLAQLRLREEEAEVLVAAPVHRHPDAMGEGGEDDDDLGIVVRQPVVADDGRLDVVLRQLPQELERDVRDDLDVHPRVVGHPEPLGLDLGHVPPGADLGIGVQRRSHFLVQSGPPAVPGEQYDETLGQRARHGLPGNSILNRPSSSSCLAQVPLPCGAPIPAPRPKPSARWR